MRLSSSRHFVLAIGASALLAGTAGANTRVEGARDLVGDSPLARPPVVLVYDFQPTGVENADAELVRTAREGAARLSQQIVEDLAKEGISARRADSTTPVPADALLIRGSIPHLDEGDRLQRTVVGMGVGAAEIRTRFEIYQQTRIARRLLWQADTVTHEGGKSPGLGASGAAAAVTGRTVGLMVSAPRALVRASPVEIHTYQTAKIVAEGLAKRYRSRGWR